MFTTKELDRIFNSIILEMDKNCIENNKDINTLLCQTGLYSKRVMNYESMHQGKFIERAIIETSNSIELQTDGKENLRHYGNCDFMFQDCPISMKSSIKKDNMFIKDGTIGASVKCKIFDASRKSIQPSDSKILLQELLTSCGYEIPIMVYAYELKTNKGKLFLSSLSEISCNKDHLSNIRMTSELMDSIENLFYFNKSSHYLMSIKDVFDTAKDFGRVYDFEYDKEQAESYVEKKIQNKKLIFDILG